MEHDYGIAYAPDKNAWLKAERGICFDDALPLLEAGAWLDIIEHPNQTQYPGRMIFVLELASDCYAVPFVIDHDKREIFLKTMFPSRALRKTYATQLDQGGRNA